MRERLFAYYDGLYFLFNATSPLLTTNQNKSSNGKVRNDELWK
ncbi:hypothetical protein [Sphingobacterium faecale]|nr:hypothetical protein [Sphingobacterium faecale]